MTGIYLITNIINQHKYVGQAKNIEHRWKQHLIRYNNPEDKEYDKVLYRAFRKYGIENFEFKIIEECEISELNNKEIYWIYQLNTLIDNGMGYNVRANFQPELAAIGETHPNHQLSMEDVKDIRTRYNNKERCKDVWKLYQNKVGWSGFSKVWKGETWKNIMMDVYTEENKNFHKRNTGQTGIENGRSVVNEKDVLNIRIRKKNGESRQQVYQDYQKTGLSQGGFDDIWYNKHWKHIQVE